MEIQMTEAFNPIKTWGSLEEMRAQRGQRGQQMQNGEASVFQSIFQNVISDVYSTQADVEQKQYLMATGQLDDAHSLPIAEAKAQISLDLLISLRNKAMESYNELLKMNV